ncbi:MAG: hypothetical protein HY069_00820 [Chlamydiia bacterium]|nr:hypothetical protein [Chlamydiia bacterium]
MSEKIIQIEGVEEVLMAKVKSAIGDPCACFVLITCSEPSETGQMEVKMHFEGDETLASFLVESASAVFDERSEKRESQ